MGLTTPGIFFLKIHMIKHDIVGMSSTFYPKQFKKDEILVQQGCVAEYVGFIVSGSAELSLVDDNGKAYPFMSLFPKDCFGVLPFFMGDGHSVRIRCDEDVESVVQGRDDFLSTVNTHVQLKHQFYQLAFNRCWQLFQNPNWHTVLGKNIPLLVTPKMLRIEKSLTYIRQNYAQQLILKSVAEKSGMSQFHFCRMFKNQTGYTLTEYLNRMRVEVAKKRLRTEGMNITEACFSVGFSDVSYFSHVFKRVTGTTPSAFRKDCVI